MYKYIFFLSIVFISSCVSQKNNEVEEVKEDLILKEIIKSKFGNSYAIIDNNSKDYTIVLTKHKQLYDLIASIKFFVYEKESKTIIFEDELNAGSINWKSDYEIIATARNITLENGEYIPKQVYLYNVRKKEKIKQ